MASTDSRNIFVNLAVRDLQRSKNFFSKLGFGLNPQFTDEKAACIIVNDEGFVMLLSETRGRYWSPRVRSPRQGNGSAALTFSSVPISTRPSRLPQNIRWPASAGLKSTRVV